MGLTVDTYCLNLRICGHLPALIINGGGDSLWKWRNFWLLRAHDHDLGSGYTAYRHASVINLYLHTKFNLNRRNFLWTDGRTYVRTDIWDPPMLWGRLRGVDLMINSVLTLWTETELNRQSVRWRYGTLVLQDVKVLDSPSGCTDSDKLAPYGTAGRLLLTANFKVTWHRKIKKNKKSGPDKL